MKTRPPQTIGVELPPSGKEVRQRTLVLASHLAGSATSLDKLSDEGPRQDGQSSAHDRVAHRVNKIQRGMPFIQTHRLQGWPCLIAKVESYQTPRTFRIRPPYLWHYLSKKSAWIPTRTWHAALGIQTYADKCLFFSTAKKSAQFRDAVAINSL